MTAILKRRLDTLVDCFQFVPFQIARIPALIGSALNFADPSVGLALLGDQLRDRGRIQIINRRTRPLSPPARALFTQLSSISFSYSAMSTLIPRLFGHDTRETFDGEAVGVVEFESCGCRKSRQRNSLQPSVFRSRQ